MTNSAAALTLHQAARNAGVIFATEAVPADREVSVHGMRFHYLDWGNEGKPPLLLLHGRRLSAHSWDFTALAFHDSFHVLALDQRGHGYSEWAANGDYTAAAQLPDIQGFVEALELRGICLVGHSMGARNAMVYTSVNPERVRAVVMVDMAPQIRREESGFGRGQQRRSQEATSFEEFVRMAHQANPRRTLEQLRGSLAHQVRQFPDGTWNWRYDPLLWTADTIGWSDERLWECAARIRCPMMLVRGGESTMVSDATVTRMMAHIPHMKAVVIPGAGHGVPGDRPVQFQQELREFFATLD